MPPVQLRSCSGCSCVFGNCSTDVSGSITSCCGLLALPGGPKTAVGANPTKCAGASSDRCGPNNCTRDGSRKPSPQVLRMVRLSSNGCQRTPTLGDRKSTRLNSSHGYI